MSGAVPPFAEIPPRTHRTPYARLLHSRNFLSLVAGISLSSWGDALFDVAVMWFVYTATGSTLQTAGVVVAQRLAPTLIGPVAGTLVDRWDRRRTMIVTDVVRGVIVLAVGIMGLRHLLLPAVGGWVADRTSPQAVFIACGIWVFLTAGLVVFNPHIRDVRVDRADG